MNTKTLRPEIGLVLVFLLLFSACKKKEEDDIETHNPTPYTLEIPHGFPTNVNIT